MRTRTRSSETHGTHLCLIRSGERIAAVIELTDQDEHHVWLYLDDVDLQVNDGTQKPAAKPLRQHIDMLV